MCYQDIWYFNEAWLSEPWRRMGLGRAKVAFVPLRDLQISDPDTALAWGCCTYQSK